MPKWTRPSEGQPECEAGDRVLLVVRERTNAKAKLRPRLVILEATEDGWDSPDPTYEGYTPEDGAFWSMERDVCAFADNAT